MYSSFILVKKFERSVKLHSSKTSQKRNSSVNASQACCDAPKGHDFVVESVSLSSAHDEGNSSYSMFVGALDRDEFVILLVVATD